MVRAGRITPEEAERVRSAATDDEREAAIAAIRGRHAGERVAAAVAAGELSPGDADDARRRLAEGEDPEGIRRLLSSVRRQRGGGGAPR